MDVHKQLKYGLSQYYLPLDGQRTAICELLQSLWFQTADENHMSLANGWSKRTILQENSVNTQMAINSIKMYCAVADIWRQTTSRQIYKNDYPKIVGNTWTSSHSLEDLATALLQNICQLVLPKLLWQGSLHQLSLRSKTLIRHSVQQARYTNNTLMCCHAIHQPSASAIMCLSIEWQQWAL